MVKLVIARPFRKHRRMVGLRKVQVRSKFAQKREKLVKEMFEAYHLAEVKEAEQTPNPFKVYPYGHCPVQAEGQLSKHEHYYFRARHESWSLTIAVKQEDCVGDRNNVLFHVESRWGKSEHIAGYMRKAIAIRLATHAITLYQDSKKTSQKVKK